MKRIIFAITVLLTAIATLAQKDASKAVVNIITYDQAGNILRSGNGFFINAEGELLAPYSLMKGAYSAYAVGHKNDRYKVVRVCGASSLYDIVRLKTNAGSNVSFLPLIADSLQTPGEGAALLLVPYAATKKDTPRNEKITKVESFDGYRYYTTTVANDAKNFGCPLVNSEGKAIGIVQRNDKQGASTACALDVRFSDRLEPRATSALNSDLRELHIPRALPMSQSEALSFIYLLGNSDSLSAITALNDFIAAFPDNAEGYVNRATFYGLYNDIIECESDFNSALQKANAEFPADAVHHNYSKVILQGYTMQNSGESSIWNLDKAVSEAQQAYAINPQPIYVLQEANCLFYKRNFCEAYDKFMQVNASPLKTAATFFSAARSAELCNGDSMLVLSLCDSTIANLSKPYSNTDAQYFFARAIYAERTGKYRQAVFDYNEYEKIVGPRNLNDLFYYRREQVEIKARMFQQALEDINSALSYRNENAPTYKVEEALIYLQAGMWDEAIGSSEQMLQAYPETADSYKIMGIAYGEKKQKAKALECLRKAKQMGDDTVDSFIAKYNK